MEIQVRQFKYARSYTDLQGRYHQYKNPRWLELRSSAYSLKPYVVEWLRAWPDVFGKNRRLGHRPPVSRTVRRDA
jgi:hypothetical protein